MHYSSSTGSGLSLFLAWKPKWLQFLLAEV